jgi:hypothetical protein
LSYEGVEKCEILNKYFCSITDLEDDGIDLPDFDDRGCNTLTTIVVSEQDVILAVSKVRHLPHLPPLRYGHADWNEARLKLMEKAVKY